MARLVPDEREQQFNEQIVAVPVTEDFDDAGGTGETDRMTEGLEIGSKSFNAGTDSALGANTKPMHRSFEMLFLATLVKTHFAGRSSMWACFASARARRDSSMHSCANTQVDGFVLLPPGVAQNVFWVPRSKAPHTTRRLRNSGREGVPHALVRVGRTRVNSTSGMCLELARSTEMACRRVPN